jgi:multimeric flavodoxin WrbA
MKITVINGNARHGSTWNCKELFCKELAKYEELEVTEFVMPKDAPDPCVGCYNCFYKGENNCPHSDQVQPIVAALVSADLIIITSPVYALDVSGGLKLLLDHLCYMWMSHRPNPSMFHKAALTIVTTAGAGLGHTSKTLKNSLSFWGIKRSFSFHKAVSAMKWEEVKPEKKQKIEKTIAKQAKNIYYTVHNIESKPYPLSRVFLFKVMSGMQKSNDWNRTDRRHWEEQGWLNGAKPY